MQFYYLGLYHYTETNFLLLPIAWQGWKWIEI